MQYEALAWLGLMILFLALEASTVVLVSMWFALGSLAALVAGLLGAELWVQAAVFLAVSCLTLAALRPIARRYLRPREKTNLDSIPGSLGTVTEDISNRDARGRVKLGAMEWTARSLDGDIPAGAQVRVVRIEGVKLMVEKADTEL